MPKNQAVLSGDLIGSRRHGAAAVDASIAALAETARNLEALYGCELRFTRSRGDGWQVLLERPSFALLACLAFAARLRAANTGLDTRIAVGVGPVDSAGTSDLADATGAALVTAGDLLARMSRHMSERWMIDGDSIDDWPRAVLALAEWIARGWTPMQAEALAMVLLDEDLGTNEVRAKRLGITRQAFEARLKGAGLDALSIPRSAFNAHDFTGGRSS